MDVNSGGDDWGAFFRGLSSACFAQSVFVDPLDGDAEAEAPVPIEELAPLPPGISAARLSTTPSKKPVKPFASAASKTKQTPSAKQQGALKLGTSAKKPNKALQEIGKLKDLKSASCVQIG